jgi:hypothetical protein
MLHARVAVDEDWPPPQAAIPVRTTIAAQASRIGLTFFTLLFRKLMRAIDAIMRALFYGEISSSGRE